MNEAFSNSTRYERKHKESAEMSFHSQFHAYFKTKNKKTMINTLNHDSPNIG